MTEYKITLRKPDGSAGPTYLRRDVTPGMAAFQVFRTYVRIGSDGRIFNEEGGCCGWIIDTGN